MLLRGLSKYGNTLCRCVMRVHSYCNFAIHSRGKQVETHNKSERERERKRERGREGEK